MAYQAPDATGNGNTAIMQDDGNFVLYDQTNDPVWASGTSGNPTALNFRGLCPVMAGF